MNPPNGQAPLDYLNQIAPQAPRRKLFELNLRTVIIGGIAVVILIIIMSILSNSIANARKEPWEHLSARLDSTAIVVTDASSKIKDSQLRSLNSDVKLYLTNTTRDLSPYLTKLSINPKKLPSAITTAESSTALMAKLEDGRLNAKYDTTYAREMGYQLSTIVALLQELANSNSGSAKAFLQAAHDNLDPTYKAIESFNTSNE